MPEHNGKPSDKPPARHERVDALQHEISNRLYSIWLQVHCAEADGEDAQLDVLMESLSRIPDAIEQAQVAVDELAALARAN